MVEIVTGDTAKSLLKTLLGKRTKKYSSIKGLKAYFKVGKRDYTAFRINDNGILRVHENLQHEGDCRTRLKIKKE